MGFRGVVISDICAVVHPEFEKSRSLDLEGVQKVVLDEPTIEEQAKPLLVYRDKAKASAPRACVRVCW